MAQSIVENSNTVILKWCGALNVVDCLYRLPTFLLASVKLLLHKLEHLQENTC